MLSCNAADFLYRSVPVRAGRAFLVRFHFERCPSCRKQLGGAAEARSLLAQNADFRASEALWQRVARSLAEPDEKSLRRSSRTARRPVWQWAAAGVVVALLAGYWVFRDFRPGGVPAAASAPARFELEYVRVGGLPANAYVYQPQGSDTVMVWAGMPQ
jgi:hypothetical protein